MKRDKEANFPTVEESIDILRDWNLNFKQKLSRFAEPPLLDAYSNNAYCLESSSSEEDEEYDDADMDLDNDEEYVENCEKDFGKDSDGKGEEVNYELSHFTRPFAAYLLSEPTFSHPMDLVTTPLMAFYHLCVQDALIEGSIDQSGVLQVATELRERAPIVTHTECICEPADDGGICDGWTDQEWEHQSCTEHGDCQCCKGTLVCGHCLGWGTKEMWATLIQRIREHGVEYVSPYYGW